MSEPRSTLKRRRVRVDPRGRMSAAVVVELDEHGRVFFEDQDIGRVYKDYRTYSPPIKRGSPIVKYHKRVPCWLVEPRSRLTFDTRAEAIRWLLDSGHSRRGR